MAEAPALQRDLAALLGDAAVVHGAALEQYLHDSTEMQGLHGRADAVVLPGSVDAVCALVAWCYEHDLPVIPRGGGTGFSGGAVPLDGGVVCALDRLATVREFTPELWRVHVDAGVTTGRVQELARRSGLYYPPDPGASEQSQIGGNIACNAGGPRCFRYGTTREWVTGVEAVVHGGELVHFGGPLRKDVAGYDMRGLLIGSEGTLGVVTGAWLRLIPAPERILPVVAAYPDAQSGVAALLRVLEFGVQASTLEYFDGACVQATRAAFPGGLPEDTRFLVTSEADGTRDSAAEINVALTDALQEGAIEVRGAPDLPPLRELQRWRSGVSFAVDAQRGGKMSEDIAVPLEHLGEAIQAVLAVGEEVGVPACSWGHAGDGNLHATFMVDAASADELRRAERGAERLFARALELGGTVSGEHGLGYVKRGQFVRQFSPAEVAMQCAIKAALDPKGLFNPGKKVFVPA